MIAIVDYGVGNIFSLYSSFKFIGEDVVLSGDADEIRRSDRIILPGVGAFGDAAMKLAERGLNEVICEEAGRGKPIMGICLGMQLLFERSFEYGEHKGLGLVSGEVRAISEVIPKGLKIPHIGWNSLDFTEDKIFKYTRQGDFVYFVHSYYGTRSKDTIATTNYGSPLTVAVRRDNIYGMQFHPEKSGNVGLSILRAFAEL